MNEQVRLSYWVLKFLGFLGRVFLGILLGMFVIIMAHKLQEWTSIERMAEYVYYALFLIAIGITAYTRKFGLVTGLLLGPFALLCTIIFLILLSIYVFLDLYGTPVPFDDFFGGFLSWVWRMVTH